MIDNIMNEYGYHDSGVDNTLMNNVLDKDNTIGLGKNTTSKTEGSWPFDQTNHSNGSTPMGTLDILSFYKKEPTPPTPSGDYMYFEAAEANSTVSMISTLATAPDLEYSTDGQTWQEWQHTTAEGTHTFDTLTLTAVGDRVYLRGDNPNGFLILGDEEYALSYFSNSGKLRAGGSVTSIQDDVGLADTLKPLPLFSASLLTESTDNTLLSTPDFSGIKHIAATGCFMTFYGSQGIVDFPVMPLLEDVGEDGCVSMFSRTNITDPIDFPNLTDIGEGGCTEMFFDCDNLKKAGVMPKLRSIGRRGCLQMYALCSILQNNIDIPLLEYVGEKGCSYMFGPSATSYPANLGTNMTLGDQAFRGMYGNTNISSLIDDGVLIFTFNPLPTTYGEGVLQDVQAVQTEMLYGF